MDILLYPVGFDPMVAAGPPTKSAIKAGCEWTPEDTENARQLELQAVRLTVDLDYKAPVGQWFQPIPDDGIETGVLDAIPNAN